MFTMEEASERWGIKPKTILEYIEKEYIDNFQCVDAQLMLPEIPKPYIPKTKDVAKEILKAYSTDCYIDHHLLGITKVRFDTYIMDLKDRGYIRLVEGENSYIVTQKAKEAIEKRRKIEINISSTLEIDPTIQVGLMNGNAGGSFL